MEKRETVPLGVIQGLYRASYGLYRGYREWKRNGNYSIVEGVRFKARGT